MKHFAEPSPQLVSLFRLFCWHNRSLCVSAVGSLSLCSGRANSLVPVVNYGSRYRITFSLIARNWNHHWLIIMVWNAVSSPQSFYRKWEKNLQETGSGLLGFEGNVFKKDTYGTYTHNQLCFCQKDTDKLKESDSFVTVGLANWTLASFVRWRS